MSRWVALGDVGAVMLHLHTVMGFTVFQCCSSTVEMQQAVTCHPLKSLNATTKRICHAVAFTTVVAFNEHSLLQAGGLVKRRPAANYVTSFVDMGSVHNIYRRSLLSNYSCK